MNTGEVIATLIVITIGTFLMISVTLVLNRRRKNSKIKRKEHKLAERAAILVEEEPDEVWEGEPLTEEQLMAIEKMPALKVRLSGVEQEVLYLYASGLSRNQIAKKIFSSAATVQQHLAAVYIVLRVESREELMNKLITLINEQKEMQNV